MAVPARKVAHLPGPSQRPRRGTGKARRPRAVRPARPPHPRARRAPVRRPRRGAPFALFALVVVTVIVMALVSAQAMVAQEAFRAAELSRSLKRLEEGHGRLRLQVAELSSPGRLVRAARRAGLVLPQDREILEVDASEPAPALPSGEGVADGSGSILAEGAGG